MTRKYAATFILLYVVAACAQLGTLPPEPPSARPERPQQIINEGKEIVLAVKRSINQNLTDRFYTANQAEKRLNEVEKWEKDLKAAEALLRLGRGGEAEEKAFVARTALRTLRSQVMERK